MRLTMFGDNVKSCSYDSFLHINASETYSGEIVSNTSTLTECHGIIDLHGAWLKR